MSTLFSSVNPEAVSKIRLHVETNSQTIDSIVAEIIEPYIRDLDNYVQFVSDCLKDGNNPPSDQELEDFCMNLAAYIYWAGGGQEQLGIRDDISNAVYKEAFNSARDETKGTVQDKNSRAEIASQQEQLVSICYSRAFKTMKSKVENAQELMSSCKKVLTRRTNEYIMTKQSIGT